MDIKQFTLCKLASGYERYMDVPTVPKYEGGKIDRWMPGKRTKGGPQLKTNIDDYPIEDVNVKQGRY